MNQVFIMVIALLIMGILNNHKSFQRKSIIAGYLFGAFHVLASLWFGISNAHS